MSLGHAVSVRLDAPLRARLEAAAARSGVSMTDLLREAAVAHLDRLAVRDLARSVEARSA